MVLPSFPPASHCPCCHSAPPQPVRLSWTWGGVKPKLGQPSLVLWRLGIVNVAASRDSAGARDDVGMWLSVVTTDTDRGENETRNLYEQGFDIGMRVKGDGRRRSLWELDEGGTALCGISSREKTDSVIRATVARHHLDNSRVNSWCTRVAVVLRLGTLNRYTVFGSVWNSEAAWCHESVFQHQTGSRYRVRNSVVHLHH
ncbi:hypothetical protein BaRGS_00036658, partial [Batillaria attramentaria]